MKIKHIDTPYWLRNKRDTVQNPNRKRKFAGVVTELEAVNVQVSEAIIDSSGDDILDSNGNPIMSDSTEQQYRVLIDEFSLLQDSDADDIVDSSGESIYSKSINKQLLI